MQFRRWVFYDESTGEVLYTGMQKGDFKPVPKEKAAAAFGVAGAACMEWTSPDPETEAAFAPVDGDGLPRVVTVSVDISGAEPTLVFTYAPMSGYDDETADMAAALALLGAAPEEGA